MCYDMLMNIRERRTLIWRFISSAFLLLVVAVGVLSLIKVITLAPEGIVLNCIALGLATLFPIGQIVVILRGWKKESHLTDILFNTNNKINNVFLIAISVASAFGLTLAILGMVALFTKENTVTRICALHVILTIVTYLLVNCAIYFLYLLLFKKRKATIEDLAK